MLRLFIAIILLPHLALGKYPNSQAEKHITKILATETPYTKQVGKATFTIDTKSYPPGNLSTMVVDYFTKYKLFEGCDLLITLESACAAVAVNGALSGVKQVITVDVADPETLCAKTNITNNKVGEITTLSYATGAKELIPNYKGKADILFLGLPWTSISKDEHAKIKQERKIVSNAFYDLDDQIIKSALTDGLQLLKEGGKVFTTTSHKTIHRLKGFCRKYGLKIKIVAADDIHRNGNINYIVELLSKKKKSH